MSYRFVPTTLLVGNFVIGTSVVAPAGILNELSSDLGVSIRVASYLIAFGSAVLCVGSPLMSWLLSRVDRRPAMAAAMLLVAVTHIASAFVTSFESLLAIRMVMHFVDKNRIKDEVEANGKQQQRLCLHQRTLRN